jgi:hypothetical protein
LQLKMNNEMKKCQNKDVKEKESNQKEIAK